MTASDLIVAAPWIVFGLALVGLCIPLIRSRRAAKRKTSRSGRSGRPGRSERSEDEDPRSTRSARQ